METESGIILPDTGKIPVDPSDPSKGTITPVMTAPQLTQGVLVAMAGLDSLQETMFNLAGQLRNALSEAADRIADLASVLDEVVTKLQANAADDLLSDDGELALQRLQEFVQGRAEAYAENEAQAAALAALQEADEEGGDAPSPPAE